MKKILGLLFLLLISVASMSQEFLPGDTVCIMITKTTGIIKIQEQYKEIGTKVETRSSGFKSNSTYLNDSYSDSLSKVKSVSGFYRTQPQTRAIEYGNYRVKKDVIVNQYNVDSRGYSSWYDGDIIMHGECPDKFNKEEKDAIINYMNSLTSIKQKKNNGGVWWLCTSLAVCTWFIYCCCSYT
jgi:hypothetical protein